ncbi:hypothetical protein ACNSVY_004166 [Klebsiella quasipneumoniae]
MTRLALSVILLYLLSGCHPALAASIPVEARQYQHELTRNARVVWGLNAPVTIPLSLALSPRDACSDQILSRFTDAVIAELHCSKGFRQSRHPLYLPQ